ncbi:MAG: metal ABC transporter permease, partial [Cytophagales bacterium]
MIEYLQFEYIQRAFLASLVVGVTCGLLGVFVTLRRMALIGDALSHSVLPGVVLAYYWFGYDSLSLFLGAVVAGLTTSFLITFIQRNSPTKDDSSVGIVFTAMFSIGIVGISWLTKRQGVHLDMKDFLFGNVLGVTNQDLWLTLSIGLFVLLSLVCFFKYFFVSTFDPTIADTMGVSTSLVHYFLMFLLSISIVSSLQSVGVILVVSMLIIPASTAYLLTNKLSIMLVLSALIGALSAFSGMSASIVLDTTPGPMMTIKKC